jgi:hypothetical protein
LEKFALHKKALGVQKVFRQADIAKNVVMQACAACAPIRSTHELEKLKGPVELLHSSWSPYQSMQR